MRILLKRMLAIWLLGLAVACLVFPFRFYHGESRTRHIVRFKRLGIVDSLASQTTGPLAGAVAVAPEDLARAPALRQALDQRLPREAGPPRERTEPSGQTLAAIAREAAGEVEHQLGSFIRIPHDEAQGFLTAAAPVDWGSFRLIYRGHLFGFQSFEAGVLQQLAAVDSLTASDTAGMPLSFHVFGPEPLFAPNVAPELRPEVVATWPAASNALAEDRPGWPDHDDTPVLAEDWRQRVAGAGLAPLPDDRFVHQGRLFEAEPSRDVYEEKVPHPRLRLATRLVGLLALLLGLLAGRGLYASSEAWGTRTSRTGPLLASDAAVLLFAGLSFVSCLDLLLAKAFGASSWIGDELLLPVSGACVLILAVPLCALFVTAQGMQRVKVDADGVEVRGLAGAERVAWVDVARIEVREISIPVHRVGILTLRPLTKTLEIETESATVTIQEPPFKDGKRALLAQLGEHAPAELSEQIDSAREDWISSW